MSFSLHFLWMLIALIGCSTHFQLSNAAPCACDGSSLLFLATSCEVTQDVCSVGSVNKNTLVFTVQRPNVTMIFSSVSLTFDKLVVDPSIYAQPEIPCSTEHMPVGAGGSYGGIGGGENGEFACGSFQLDWFSDATTPPVGIPGMPGEGIAASGREGGALKIIITDTSSTLNLNALAVYVNGMDGGVDGANLPGGGGSGGTIYITSHAPAACSTAFSASAGIYANGGNGLQAPGDSAKWGGSGSGGRVFIEILHSDGFDWSTLSACIMQVVGGSGNKPGGPGTITIKEQNTTTLIVSGTDGDGDASGQSGIESFPLTTAVAEARSSNMTGSITVDNVRLLNDARLSPIPPANVVLDNSSVSFVIQELLSDGSGVLHVPRPVDLEIETDLSATSDTTVSIQPYYFDLSTCSADLDTCNAETMQLNSTLMELDVTVEGLQLVNQSYIECRNISEHLNASLVEAKSTIVDLVSKLDELNSTVILLTTQKEALNETLSLYIKMGNVSRTECLRNLSDTQQALQASQSLITDLRNQVTSQNSTIISLQNSLTLSLADVQQLNSSLISTKNSLTTVNASLQIAMMDLAHMQQEISQLKAARTALANELEYTRTELNASCADYLAGIASCVILEPPNDANLQCTGLSEDHTCQLTCSSTYTANGPTVFSCSNDGYWVGLAQSDPTGQSIQDMPVIPANASVTSVLAPTTCQKSTCNVPNTPVGGSVECSMPLRENATCTFKCREGYELRVDGVRYGDSNVTFQSVCNSSLVLHPSAVVCYQLDPLAVRPDSIYILNALNAPSSNVSLDIRALAKWEIAEIAILDESSNSLIPLVDATSPPMVNGDTSWITLAENSTTFSHLGGRTHYDGRAVFTVDVSGLSLGVYTGQIRIQTVDNSFEQLVPIELDIGNPEVRVEPTDLVLVTVRKNEVGRGLFELFNEGTAPLTYSVQIVPSITWGSIDENSGTVDPGGRSAVVLSVDASDLVTGEYSSQLIVTTNVNSSAPIVLDWKLRVATASSLMVIPDELQISLTPGQETLPTISILNLGIPAFDFRISLPRQSTIETIDSIRTDRMVNINGVQLPEVLSNVSDMSLYSETVSTWLRPLYTQGTVTGGGFTSVPLRFKYDPMGINFAGDRSVNLTVSASGDTQNVLIHFITQIGAVDPAHSVLQQINPPAVLGESFDVTMTACDAAGHPLVRGGDLFIGYLGTQSLRQYDLGDGTYKFSTTPLLTSEGIQFLNITSSTGYNNGRVIDVLGSPLMIPIVRPNCSAINAVFDTVALTCVCDVGYFSQVDYSHSNYTTGNATITSDEATGRTCLPCSRGTHKPSIGDDPALCLTCPSGHVAEAEGLANCKKCPAGTFASEFGLQCTSCPRGSISSVDGSEKCTVCDAGYFANYNSTSCETCPISGAECSDGILRIKNDYWWEDAGSVPITSKTLLLPCKPGTCNVHRNLSMEYFSVDCAPGHVGVMCRECDSSFADLGSACQSCPPSWINLLCIILFCMAVLILGALVVKRAKAKRDHDVTSLMRVLLSFLQIMSLLSSSSGGVPGSVFAVFTFLSVSNGVSFDIFPVECEFNPSFYDILYAYMILPVVIVLLCIGVVYFWVFLRKYICTCKGGGRQYTLVDHDVHVKAFRNSTASAKALLRGSQRILVDQLVQEVQTAQTIAETTFSNLSSGRSQSSITEQTSHRFDADDTMNGSRAHIDTKSGHIEERRKSLSDRSGVVAWNAQPASAQPVGSYLLGDPIDRIENDSPIHRHDGTETQLVNQYSDASAIAIPVEDAHGHTTFGTIHDTNSPVASRGYQDGIMASDHASQSSQRRLLPRGSVPHTLQEVSSVDDNATDASKYTRGSNTSDHSILSSQSTSASNQMTHNVNGRQFTSTDSRASFVVGNSNVTTSAVINDVTELAVVTQPSPFTGIIPAAQVSPVSVATEGCGSFESATIPAIQNTFPACTQSPTTGSTSPTQTAVGTDHTTLADALSPVVAPMRVSTTDDMSQVPSLQLGALDRRDSNGNVSESSHKNSHVHSSATSVQYPSRHAHANQTMSARDQTRLHNNTPGDELSRTSRVEHIRTVSTERSNRISKSSINHAGENDNDTPTWLAIQSKATLSPAPSIDTRLNVSSDFQHGAQPCCTSPMSHPNSVSEVQTPERNIQSRLFSTPPHSGTTARSYSAYANGIASPDVVHQVGGNTKIQRTTHRGSVPSMPTKVANNDMYARRNSDTVSSTKFGGKGLSPGMPPTGIISHSKISPVAADGARYRPGHRNSLNGASNQSPVVFLNSSDGFQPRVSQYGNFSPSGSPTSVVGPYPTMPSERPSVATASGVNFGLRRDSRMTMTSGHPNSARRNSESPLRRSSHAKVYGTQSQYMSDSQYSNMHSSVYDAPEDGAWNGQGGHGRSRYSSPDASMNSNEQVAFLQSSSSSASTPHAAIMFSQSKISGRGRSASVGQNPLHQTDSAVSILNVKKKKSRNKMTHTSPKRGSGYAPFSPNKSPTNATNHQYFPGSFSMSNVHDVSVSENDGMYNNYPQDEMVRRLSQASLQINQSGWMSNKGRRLSSRISNELAVVYPSTTFDIVKKAMVVLLFMAHNKITQIVFSVFDRYPYQIGGKYLLNADMTVVTETSDYRIAQLCAIVMLVGFTIGIPLFTLAYMFRNRRRLQHPTFRYVWGFLYGGLDLSRQVWWWEVLNIIRKAMLSAVFTMASDAFMQVYYAAIIITAFLLLHVAVAPYDSMLVHFAETGSMVTTLGVLLTMLLYHQKGDSVADTVATVILALVGVTISGLLLATVKPARDKAIELLDMAKEKCPLKCGSRRTSSVMDTSKPLDPEYDTGLGPGDSFAENITPTGDKDPKQTLKVTSISPDSQDVSKQ